MYFPHQFINWTSQFPSLRLLVGIVHFYSNFKRIFYKQTVDNLIIRRFECKAASDLVLQCLPMSHKKDARLIWVKESLEQPLF